MPEILKGILNKAILSVGGGASWYLLASIVQGSLALVTATIFSHIMNQTDFGLLAIILAFSYFLTPVCSIGVSHAISRSLFDDLVLGKKHLISLGILIITSIIVLFAVVSLVVLGEKPSREVTLIIISTASLSMRELTLTLLRVNGSYKNFLVVISLMSLSGLVIPLICHIILGAVVLESYVFTMLATHLLAISIFTLREKNSKEFTFPSLRYSLYVSVAVLPHTISIITLANMDRIIMSQILSLQSIALYFGVFQLANVVFLIISSLNNSYSRSILKEDITFHLKRYEQDYKKILIMVLILMLAVHTVGRFYLEIFFPDYFRDDVVFVSFAILCFSGFFQVKYLMNVTLISRLEIYKSLSFINPLILCLSILNMALLTFFFGIVGTALAYTCGNLFLSIATQELLKRNENPIFASGKSTYLILASLGFGFYLTTKIESVLTIVGFLQATFCFLGSLSIFFLDKKLSITKF